MRWEGQAENGKGKEVTLEEKAAVRRVLRMVDGYLARQPQDTLLTDGRGLMTWGEIRLHVRGARKLLTEKCGPKPEPR